MDRFQVGDKVNFLNDKGGGIITKIIDTKMVMVDTDGFEIPFLMSDLVLDYRSQPHKKQITEIVQKEIKREETEKAEAADNARRGTLRRFAAKSEEEGFYLAFVPHDQQWLLTGPIDVVLLNHTESDILYNFSVQNGGKTESVDSGEAKAHSKVTIETISRDDIDFWCNGLVQALVVKKESECAFKPLNASYSIRSSRFFKDGSYAPLNCLGEKAVSICLSAYSLLKATSPQLDELAKNGIGSEVAKTTATRKTAAIDKHRTAPCEAVVDLHIGELVDNILGLSSHDMFRIQMDYFRRMLDSAIENEYTKVTFIHGVGNGVLKNAIIEELKNSENTSSRMASLAKFGVGAIDVIIKDKK